MKSKFNIIYEQIMNSLICEGWTMYDCCTVAAATYKVTNGFTLPYVKGETGRKVLDLILQNNVDNIGDDIMKNIVSASSKYWIARQKFASNDFTNKIRNFMYEWSIAYFAPGPYRIKAQEVGAFVYGLCTAMQKDKEKKENNLRQVGNLDTEFAVGKVYNDLKLTVTQASTSNEPIGRYGRQYFIKGKDARWPDITFNIDASCVDMKNVKHDSITNMPKERYEGNEYYRNIAELIFPKDIINFSGEVKSFRPEYKTVYMKKCKLISVDHFEFWPTNENFSIMDHEKYRMHTLFVKVVTSNGTIDEDSIKNERDKSVKLFLQNAYGSSNYSEEMFNKFMNECEADSLEKKLYNIRNKMGEIVKALEDEYTKLNNVRPHYDTNYDDL